jgi:hypothetical protein
MHTIKALWKDKNPSAAESIPKTIQQKQKKFGSGKSIHLQKYKRKIY